MEPASGVHQHLMGAFSRVCGQNPATSPFFLGYQSPLCYRCLGIYLAFACGLLVRRRAEPTVKRLSVHLGLAVLALAVLALDVFVVQRASPNNATRFLTGFVAGWTLSSVFRDSLRILWGRGSAST